MLIWSLFFAGQLPKELSKLVNLKVLNVSDNILFDHEGEEIPGTGLSGMQMVAPSLSASYFELVYSLFLQDNCPRNSENL